MEARITNVNSTLNVMEVGITQCQLNSQRNGGRNLPMSTQLSTRQSPLTQLQMLYGFSTMDTAFTMV